MSPLRDIRFIGRDILSWLAFILLFFQAVFHPHTYQIRALSEGRYPQNNIFLNFQTWTVTTFKDIYTQLHNSWFVSGHNKILWLYLTPAIILAILLNIPRYLYWKVSWNNPHPLLDTSFIQPLARNWNQITTMLG